MFDKLCDILILEILCFYSLHIEHKFLKKKLNSPFKLKLERVELTTLGRTYSKVSSQHLLHTNLSGLH